MHYLCNQHVANNKSGECMQPIGKVQGFEWENKFMDSYLTLSLWSLYKKVKTPWFREVVVVKLLRSWRKWILGVSRLRDWSALQNSVDKNRASKLCTYIRLERIIIEWADQDPIFRNKGL